MNRKLYVFSIWSSRLLLIGVGLCGLTLFAQSPSEQTSSSQPAADKDKKAASAKKGAADRHPDLGVAVDSGRKSDALATWITTENNPGEDAGPYIIKQSVEFGGRISDYTGNVGTWDTFVNMGTGPRLLEYSMEIHSPTHSGFLFDDLTFSNFGYGGDPNNVSRVRAQKGKFYSLTGGFRRDQNIFDYNLFANPLNPTGSVPTIPIAHSPHEFLVTRRMSDLNLNLFPVSRVRFKLGWNRVVNEGSSFTSDHQGTDALLFQPTLNTTDNYNFGVSFRILPRTNINYDQFYTHFKGDTTANLPTVAQMNVFGIPGFFLSNGSPAMLTAAIQHSPDFIGITDLQGNILFLNHAGQKLVGLRDDAEARSKTVYDFMGPQSRAILETQILPAVREKRVWEGEFSLRHFVTQEPVLFDTRGFGIFDEAGRLTNIATVSRDISEKKKLEEQLREAQQMEAVGRLAGGIAHDFNNLLTIIQGSGEILEEQVQGAGSLKNVRRIRDAAQRASDLTQQLLAFSRRQLVSPAIISLNQVILRMQEILQRLVGEDIVIKTELADDLWNVKMDPLQMEQILFNLIANARDAMPHGGVVAVRTFNHELIEPPADQPELSPAECVCMTFSDSGSSVDHQTLSHIFEPFFSSKELGRGSGLGLATVYGIVQQCSGSKG